MRGGSGSRSIPARRSGRSTSATGATEVRARAAEHGLGAGELDRLAALPRRAVARADSASSTLAERLFSAGGLTATAEHVC